MTKILLIDDSEFVRESVSIMLSKAGYEVIAPPLTVGVGAQILRHRPELVLLDLSMPLLDGEDIMQTINSHDSLRKTLVLFFSDRSEAELLAAAKRAGTAGYICKTGDVDHFVQQIEYWLAQRPANIEPRTSFDIPMA